MIETLAAKDIAYRAEDGSWYFRIARFPEYGKLSARTLPGSKMERASMWMSMRRMRRAILLCGRRPNPRAELGDISGAGASWVAYRVLGYGEEAFWADNIDLHAGGEDLMFPAP